MFTAQITVPAKKPVLQQPLGLKMRFHPIGFDAEHTGSGSDQDMLDAPAAEFRRAGAISWSESSDEDDHNSGVKTTVHFPPSKSRGRSKTLAMKSTKLDSTSMKRMQSEGETKSSKHSSSKSANITNNRKLKRIKIQVENQKIRGSQSSSTEAYTVASTILPPKAQTRILPPVSATITTKSLIAPLSSFAASTEPHALDTQTRAIYPNLTMEEHKKEINRPKKIRDSPKAKQGEGKSSASRHPSSKKGLTYGEQMHSTRGTAETEKKKRGTEQIETDGLETIEAAVKISVPRSTAPILLPKYAVKR
jgi:hypothetical protein